MRAMNAQSVKCVVCAGLNRIPGVTLYINECKLNGTQATEINITVQVNGTPNRSSNTPTLT